MLLQAVGLAEVRMGVLMERPGAHHITISSYDAGIDPNATA